MPGITAVLTASVTLIPAFSTTFPPHNNLLFVYVIVLLLTVTEKKTQTQHSRSWKTPLAIMFHLIWHFFRIQYSRWSITMKVFAEMRRILKCSHSGAANGKVTRLVHLSILLILCLCFIFCSAPRGYFPPGFRRARSFISSENCFAAFQSFGSQIWQNTISRTLMFLICHFFWV